MTTCGTKIIPKGVYIGLDVASKTGWAIVESDGKTIKLTHYGSVSIPKGTSTVAKMKFLGDFLISCLDPIFPKDKLGEKELHFVVEGCYMGINPGMTIELALMEGYISNIAMNRYKGTVDIITAVSARKQVGVVKGKVSGDALKQLIVDFVNNMLGQQLFQFEHHNIADAVVLAIAGGGVNVVQMPKVFQGNKSKRKSTSNRRRKA